MTAKAFLKLQREWYERLSNETDFVDIERNGLLINFERYRWVGCSNKKPPEVVHLDAEYYYLATQFLNEWAPLFLNEFELIVWEMHSDGETVREIAETLNELGHQTSKDVVAKVIRDAKDRMLVVMNVA